MPDQTDAKIPIGEAVTNDYIYILDEQLNPVPVGEEGEICIGGAGVAKGYLNRPELTAERFVADPNLPGQKMYRTGDIGRQLENGLFDFVGRRDFQVKLRGQRIELGEIEFALQQIPELSESVVLFSKDRFGDDCIVAYMKLMNHAETAQSPQFYLADQSLVSRIVSKLSDFLTAYMIPSEFVICQKFPLTANGKIDRAVLTPISELINEDSFCEFNPNNDTEKRLVEIWCEVLGRNRIGETDEFFKTGGHSLKAVQMISSIIKAFGCQIPLKEFYNKMTIVKLCQLVANELDLFSFGDIEETIDSAISEFPLTPVQTEMWIVNNFDETGLTHNIQIEFSFNGKIDVSFFEQKLRETILAEETFRSTFPSVDGQPIQRIHSTIEFAIPFDDISDYQPDSREKCFENFVLENGNVRFDLEKLPLFSFRLIKYSPENYRLLLSIHHLIFDGWSLNLFMKRLHQRLIHIEPSKPNYRNGDYALWLKNRLKGELRNRELEFWKDRLNGIPERITLPLKPNFNREKSGRYGDRFWWEIPKETTLAIDQLAQQLGVTPFVLVMSAFQVVLATASGQDDVVVGTPFANRAHPMVNDLIGYFTNMVSIRTRIDSDHTLQNLIDSCNEMSIEAFSNATIPFGEVAKQLRGNFAVDKNPIYQVIFVMQNWPHETFSTPDFSFSQKEIGNHTSKIDLLLNVELVNDAYTCWLEFDTMLYDKELITKLSSGIGFVLNLMTESVDDRLEDVQAKLLSIVKPVQQHTAMLVGEGSLLIQCLDVLLSHNFLVTTIITTDSATIHAAQRHKIRCVSDTSDLTKFELVDYIFSINNELLLKSDFLYLARKEAINYHDSPLPRYAGLYATHHALLNGESEWAVSWHRIVDEIDAGDILHFERVEIYPDDNVLTLNNRCFEKSIWSFTTLLQRLKSADFAPIKQVKELRTYYGLSHRPQSMGFLQWFRTSEELNALIRACHTGDFQDNEFLMPSLMIDNQLFFVGNAVVRKGDFGVEGEMIRYKNSWAIACRDGCVTFSRLYNKHCTEVDLNTLFVEGMILDSPDSAAIDSIGIKYRQIAKYEPFWKKLLSQSEFLSSPCVSSLESSEYAFPISLFDSVKETKEVPLLSIVAALSSIFTLKMSYRSEGLVAIVRSNASAPASIESDYFANWIPFSAQIVENETLNQSLSRLCDHFSLLERSKTFCSNLFLRYPSLRAGAKGVPSVMIVEEGTSIPLIDESGLLFIVGEHQITIRGASQSFAHAFATFAKEAVANLHTETNRLRLFTDEDAKQNFFRINKQDSRSKLPSDVIQMFWQTVTKYPNNTAIFDQGKIIDYKQLGEDVTNTAAVLRKYGVVSGSVVAVAIPRSYDYFHTILSIMHCGAAFLPIDSALSIERKRFMVEDAKAILLITKGEALSVSGQVPAINIETLPLENETSAVEPNFDNNNLAYIIYTSGSTGVPKGVKIDRGALANFISGAMSLYSVSADDRILQFSNLSFDASIEEIFLAFSAGASLYLRYENLLSPSEFLQFSIENSITVWDLPTAFWRQIVAFEKYVVAVEQLAVRLVIVGGEALTLPDVNNWSEKTPSHRLFNTYGPTETTVVALAHEIEASVSYTKHIPIGRPLSGYFAQIVDDKGNVMPEGVVGELFVGGQSVSQGYVSATTNQALVFDSMQLPDGTTVKGYKTGDLVFSDAEGLIYYVGRKDEQVKIRGYRIEPAEIERQICKFAGVENCAVIVVKQKSGEKSLIAFFTTQNSIAIESSTIKSDLFSRLPNYMVPQFFLQVEFIPLTMNGKIDKRALEQKAMDLISKKQHDGDKVVVDSDYSINEEITELRTKIDEVATPLLRIIHELSGDNGLGYEHDLLFSGFDSLKFIRLIVEIENDFGIRLSISDIYKYPTVNELARVIVAQRTIVKSDIITCIREGKKGATPLFMLWGAGQQVLQFNDMALHLDPDTPIYLLHAPIVKGEVEIPDTMEALAWLYVNEIQRHFPMQKVHLAGYSFGGFVVYEMARLMLENGYPFDKLFVIDASSVFVRYKGQPEFIYQTVVIRCKIFWLLTRSPLKQFYTIIRNIRQIITQFRIKQRINEEHNQEDEIPLEFNDLLQRKAEELTVQYVIKPLNIHIYLLTSKSHIKYGGLKMRWQRYARLGVHPHFMECYHADIFKKANVANVAQWLQDCLNYEYED